MNVLISLLGSFWRLSLSVRIAVMLLVFGGVITLFRINSPEEAPLVALHTDRVVSLASVGELSSATTPLPLLGMITSRSEAVIKAESSGKLVAVYKKLGDYVEAGAIIAEFENSAERAGVLQAEGAYEATKANKGITQIQEGSAELALGEAKTGAQNTLSSAYATLDDVIRTKTDLVWQNPQGRTPNFILTVPDERLLIKLQAERIEIERLLLAREAKNKTLTQDSDLIAELNAAEEEARYVKGYLDDLSLALSRAITDGNASPSAIEGYKGTTGSARTTISGVLAAITAGRSGLNTSMSANDVASKNAALNSNESGGEAQIKSALGNLQAAEVRLEKTIIRSPISGTLNSLSIQTGDFVSPFADVAVVSNNGALEVLSYITEADAEEFQVGSKAVIETTHSGIVTRIAPAIDPKTKKIEVRIGISGNTSGLINGQSVSIEVTRTRKKSSRVAPLHIEIPLSALKLTPGGAVVFTVNDEMLLIAHPVKEGRLQGEHIVILEGLTSDMQIVTDARGLKTGMKVSITK